MSGCPSCKSSDVYPVPEGASWFWACNDCGICGPDDESRERALQKWHEMPLPKEPETSHVTPQKASRSPGLERWLQQNEVKPGSPLLALLMKWRELGKGPLTAEQQRIKDKDDFPDVLHYWEPRNKETRAIWEAGKNENKGKGGQGEN